MFTAIGFSTEHEGFCASTGVVARNPQDVAVALKSQFGIWFEQILLTQNGEDGPEVVEHWNIDKDYQEV